MLSKVQIKFLSFLLTSSVVTALLPFTATTSQALEVSQQEVQGNSRKPKTVNNSPERMSQSNLLAENVKPSVVKVVLGCKAKVYLPKNGKVYNFEGISGYGSGFFVHRDGYLATNAHVTDWSVDECKQLFQEKLAKQLKTDGENLNNVEKKLKWIEIRPINLVYLPNGEKLPFKNITSGAPAGKGKDISIIKINVQNAPALKLANSNKVQLMDSVVVVGYPGIVNELPQLDDKSSYEATFTAGSVSAKKAAKDGTPLFQIIGPVPHGNSGGPVLNQQGEVIGIVTFGPNDDFTFIFTSNTIQEFLAKTGIHNEQSFVKLQYSEGLKLYSQGQYRQALQKFQLVKQLFPHHSEVEKYLQNCQEVIANGN
jgi:serine protease Do